ncbi:MAG: hypothetical protein ACE5HO_19265, partial [bacterium]
MINTLKIYEDLKETVEPAAAKKFAEIFGMIYEDLQNTVTKTEFNELKAVVKDLAEAQKRTEAKVESLAVKIEELTEAQKRTEARV